MHGVPKAIRSKSLSGRVFWSLVCLGAALMFCLQFLQLLRKYYSYPKRVTIDIVPTPVPFPAISLCNMRNLDIIVLNNLNKIFKEATDPLEWGNYTQDPFINEYMNVVAKYYPMFVNPDIDMHVFQTVLTRTLIATNIDRELVSRAGVPFKEFIVTCRMGGLDCDRTRDFHQFFDSYYYNCFTYISPYQPQSHDSVIAEGLENGWSTVVLTGAGMLDKNDEMRMIPGTHDRVSPMSSNEGVRVVIHPPDTEPYPHTEGFDVAPGYSVSFGVKARKNIRIGPPHGNCSMKNPVGNDKYSYRLISCQKKCLQKYVVEKCGCIEVSLPGHDMYPHLKFCTSDSDIPAKCRETADDDCVKALFTVYNRFLCVRNASMHMTQNATATRSCGCYPPCHESNYDISYSLSKWPAESFDGEEAYIDIFETASYPSRFNGSEDKQKLELYADYFDPKNRRVAMKDFARLNVYVADSNVLKTEESEEYTQSQLLSDIGGQLGLWVGISVITIAEVLELVVDIVKWVLLRNGPCAKGRTFSKDPEVGEPEQQELNGKKKNKVKSCSCSYNNQMNGNIPLTAVYEEEHEPPDPVI